ncbi:MAG TPA: type 1 periplasmic binding fold superfamily protein, partial [Flavobacterium sp.]|nr:type 1 periplasmic binding fold superfamily protein [Flavobacterium sp.]
VTLIHKPNKTASGVEAGDITNAGGSRDAEVSFPISVN